MGLWQSGVEDRTIACDSEFAPPGDTSMPFAELKRGESDDQLAQSVRRAAWGKSCFAQS